MRLRCDTRPANGALTRQYTPGYHTSIALGGRLRPYGVTARWGWLRAVTPYGLVWARDAEDVDPELPTRLDVLPRASHRGPAGWPHPSFQLRRRRAVPPGDWSGVGGHCSPPAPAGRSSNPDNSTYGGLFTMSRKAELATACRVK